MSQAKTKPEPEKKENEKGKDDEKAKSARTVPGPLAVVTWYRYFDDITVFSTVDLGKAKVVAVEAVQHLRTPLSNSRIRRSPGARSRAERRGETAPRAVRQGTECLSAVQPVHPRR